MPGLFVVLQLAVKRRRRAPDHSSSLFRVLARSRAASKGVDDTRFETDTIPVVFAYRVEGDRAIASFACDFLDTLGQGGDVFLSSVISTYSFF